MSFNGFSNLDPLDNEGDPTYEAYPVDDPLDF